MSVTGKKLSLQPAPARTAMTDSNPKAAPATAAKGPVKTKATVSIAAATQRDTAILQVCRRKLVGKRPAILKLLNAADVIIPRTRCFVIL